MSSRDCNSCSNLLRRDGTSQKQRLFDELQKDYVKIDERSYIDLIKHALRQAEKLQFWDVFNRRSGDWVAFFENTQAKTYTDIVYSDVKGMLESFNVHYNAEFTSAAVTREEIIEMISDIFEIATRLDGWYAQIDSELELSEELQNIIQRQAIPLIRTLIELDKGAEQELRAVPGPEGTLLSSIDYDSLSDFWGIDATTGETNTKVFIGGTISERGDAAKRHFRVLFESMLSILEKLMETAEESFTELLDDYGKHEPHFALFLTFIQLFKYAQDHINEFTDKHIDFYYRDVLQLAEKEAVPDRVHVLFNLAKNIDQKLVEAGTELKAGKDEDGVNIVFETDEQFVANKANVASIKTVFLDRGKSSKYIQTIYSAQASNSVDGNGKAFTEKNPSWEPFGKSQVSDGVLIEDQTMEEARVGFAIASPEFRMREGQRKLIMSLILNQTEFDNIFGANGSFEEFLNVNQLEIDGEPVLNNLEGYGNLLSRWLKFRLSGEEGWVIPDNIENDGFAKITVGEMIGAFEKTIVIELNLSKEQAPIIGYDTAVHEKNYKSKWPVLEILCEQSPITPGEAPQLAYEFLKTLRVDRIKFDTEVQGVTTLKLSNDTGVINPAKPFFPFSSNPQVGSNFYVGSAEVFSKRLTYLNIGLDWKSVPDASFSDYYELYRKEGDPNPQRIVEDNAHFTAQIKFLEDFGWKDLSYEDNPAEHVELYQSSSVALKQSNATITASLFMLMAIPIALQQLAQNIKSWSALTINRSLETANFVNLFRAGETIDNDPDSSTGNDARLPRKIEVQSKENDVPFADYKTNFDLLTPDESNGFKRDPSIYDLPDYSDGIKRGYVKLELINDFFHAAYARILTERAVSTTAVGTPNVPYTPELHRISLDYKSTYELNYAHASTTWEDREEQFYHITPFGEVEVFPKQPEKQITEEAGEIYYSDHLLPQLFKKAKAITADGRPETKVDIDTGRSVDIILEETSEGMLFVGIEDLTPPMNLSLLFQFKEGTEDNDLEVPAVQWSYMSNDQWVAFENSDIVSDDTKGLVRSGIIQFAFSEEATNDNELLGNGYHWIRASVSGNTEAFSNLISVNAQAAKATYAENGNSPYRLQNPIEPNTVSKFVDKDFEVKTLSQPYESFGGRMKEQKSEFYTRVSERLRHKQRGITIRDYEHIVLEEFPEIYKVKCVNHTSRYSEYAPGNVSVIVIPYFKNLNERNPFELKVSKAKLGEIRSLLVKLNSPFVKLDVRNPKYEAIKVRFGVEFHVGYDRTFYKEKLNEEIKEFLSPWAFGKEEDLIFGGSINRSIILNFVEERPYVDYVTNFQMFHKEDENRALIEKFVAEGTTASSVLVTALDHIIEEASCDPVDALGSGNDYAFDHDSHNDSYN